MFILKTVRCTVQTFNLNSFAINYILKSIVADKFNIKTTFVTDVTDPINIQKALQANTKVYYCLMICFIQLTNLFLYLTCVCVRCNKLVWIESPSNPTMKLVDIERVASIVHSTKNKNKGDILLAVDNTFLSPYFQVSSHNKL